VAHPACADVADNVMPRLTLDDRKIADQKRCAGDLFFVTPSNVPIRLLQLLFLSLEKSEEFNHFMLLLLSLKLDFSDRFFFDPFRYCEGYTTTNKVT